MWNMKSFAEPVMISETRIVAKVLKNYPETISGKHPIDSL